MKKQRGNWQTFERSDGYGAYSDEYMALVEANALARKSLDKAKFRVAKLEGKLLAAREHLALCESESLAAKSDFEQYALECDLLSVKL